MSLDLSRREFLRTSAGGGFALGGLLGLGMDLRAAQAEVRSLKIANAREVPSVCPYCAVGCGEIVSVRGGQIINIESNPESPINRGTLCPKGAASFQLTVNPERQKKALYRRPNGTAWEETELSRAMDMVAERVKAARDATWEATDPKGRGVNRTLGIAHLGGATLDNEENYLLKKLYTALGVVQVENQARI